MPDAQRYHFSFSLQTQLRAVFKSLDDIYKMGMVSAFNFSTFGSFGVFDFFLHPAEPDPGQPVRSAGHACFNNSRVRYGRVGA